MERTAIQRHATRAAGIVQALLADMMDVTARRSVPRVAEAVMREAQVTSALSSAAHLTPERRTVATKSVA